MISFRCLHRQERRGHGYYRGLSRVQHFGDHRSLRPLLQRGHTAQLVAPRPRLLLLPPCYRYPYHSYDGRKNLLVRSLSHDFTLPRLYHHNEVSILDKWYACNYHMKSIFRLIFRIIGFISGRQIRYFYYNFVPHFYYFHLRLKTTQIEMLDFSEFL